MAKQKKDKATQKVIDVLQGNAPSTRTFGWTPAGDKEYAKFKKEEKEKKDKEHDEISEVLKTARMPWFCPKCNGIMSAKVDDRMWMLHGSCMKCVAKMETKLRATGQYARYEKEKMVRNAIGQLKDYKLKFEEALKQSARQTYFNDDGTAEHWDMPEEQLEAIKSDIRKDIILIDESLQNLEKELEEFLIEKA